MSQIDRSSRFDDLGRVSTISLKNVDDENNLTYKNYNCIKFIYFSLFIMYRINFCDYIFYI